MEYLMKICELSLDQRRKLLYRATEDGFGAYKFHSKCDKQPNTLVIIKSTSGNVFGGYTEQDWSDHDEWTKNDKNAFLFSYKNKTNKPVKINCIFPNFAIICRSNCGPRFGKNDLWISNDSNNNMNSYSKVNDVYEHPYHRWYSESELLYLAGTEYFQTVEIEVFTME